MSRQGTNGPNWERLGMDENGWEWFKAKYKKTKYKVAIKYYLENM